MIKKINDDFLGASAFRKIAQLYNIDNPDEHPSFQLAMTMREEMQQLDYEKKDQYIDKFSSYINSHLLPNHLAKAISHNMLDEEEIILTISLMTTYFSFITTQYDDIKFDYFTKNDKKFLDTLENSSLSIFQRYYYPYFMEILEENNDLDNYYMKRKKDFLKKYSAEFAQALYYENNLELDDKITLYQLVIFKKETKNSDDYNKQFESAWAGMLIEKEGIQYFQDANGIYLLNDFLQNFPFSFSDNVNPEKTISVIHIKDHHDLRNAFSRKFSNRHFEIAIKLVSKDNHTQKINNIENNICDVCQVYSTIINNHSASEYKKSSHIKLK